MPYEVMVKKAHNILDEIPHEKIEYVVQFLLETKNALESENACYEYESQKAFARLQKNRRSAPDIDYDAELERKRAGKDLMLFAGTLRADIDEKKILNEWRNERFGTAS